MATLANQSLMYCENLSLPSFQVIVMSPNMGCKSCWERVFRVISKMTGLKEYTVDLRNKQVIVKGDLRISIGKLKTLLQREMLKESAIN